MSDKPKRVQVTWRKPGGRKPENTVLVARPSRWGNPFKIGDPGIPNAETAVREFRETIPHLVADIRAELRGKDLACYCPILSIEGVYCQCHADVLLSIANNTPIEEVTRENIKWAKRKAMQ